ncbi:MAG: hypothetical protein MJ250_06035 [Alphaproteobacteria bacterium]|nr:hypothetical protein [Alphaproteobacteria bacterium]
MTKEKAKDVDFLINAAFDLPAPEMPAIFEEDNRVIELTDDDMEFLVAAGAQQKKQDPKSN